MALSPFIHDLLRYITTGKLRVMVFVISAGLGEVEPPRPTACYATTRAFERVPKNTIYPNRRQARTLPLMLLWSAPSSPDHENDFALWFSSNPHLVIEITMPTSPLIWVRGLFNKLHWDRFALRTDITHKDSEHARELSWLSRPVNSSISASFLSHVAYLQAYIEYIRWGYVLGRGRVSYKRDRNHAN